MRHRPAPLPTMAAAAMLLAAGCSFQRMATRAIQPMLDDVGKSLYRQTDLKLAKDGLPTFMLMIDGLIESNPNDRRLLLTGAQAYSAYAMAFVEDEDPGRAMGMYRKALRYSLRALWPGMTLEKAQVQPQEAFDAAVAKTRSSDGPAVYWTASTWASWIVMNSGSVDALADLPRVAALMERALAIDDTYQHGGPHLFMGVYYAARPKQIGGEPEKAKEEFEKAIRIDGDDFLLAKVYYAKFYARQVFDKKLHDRLLKEVLAAKVVDGSDNALLNTVAQAKAKVLLAESDDYF